MASLDASRISSKYSLSRCIDRFCGTEYGILANIIPTRFDATFAYKVNFSSKDYFQLILHINKVKQRVMGILIKSNKHIKIAVRLEVVPEHRAEKSKFAYFPLLAQFDYFFFWYFNMRLAHYSISSIFKLSIPLSSIILTAIRLFSPISKGNEVFPRYASINSSSITALRFFASLDNPSFSPAISKHVCVHLDFKQSHAWP